MEAQRALQKSVQTTKSSPRSQGKDRTLRLRQLRLFLLSRKFTLLFPDRDDHQLSKSLRQLGSVDNPYTFARKCVRQSSLRNRVRVEVEFCRLPSTSFGPSTLALITLVRLPLRLPTLLLAYNHLFAPAFTSCA